MINYTCECNCKCWGDCYAPDYDPTDICGECECHNDQEYMTEPPPSIWEGLSITRWASTTLKD